MPLKERQEEFLLATGDRAILALPQSDDPLMQEIADIWGLPLGERVRIVFQPSESLAVIEGRLEITAAPAYPFDHRQPLELRIRRHAFSSRAIASCARLG